MKSLLLPFICNIHVVGIETAVREQNLDLTLRESLNLWFRKWKSVTHFADVAQFGAALDHLQCHPRTVEERAVAAVFIVQFPSHGILCE
jgi:hypothetical protein